MFDSAENRYVYEDAKSRHDEMMDADCNFGKAYRFGWIGKSYSENPTFSYEHWRAGRDNAKQGSDKE